MKRLTIITGVALMICCGLIFAETSMLIDFAVLEPDVDVGGKGLNTATMVDFSKIAGASYTEEEKKLMKVSLAVEEWEVQLAGSSRTVQNMRYSTTKAVTSKKYGTVMGARVHFPTGSYNSWALIKPPFEIPAYQKPTKYENGDIVELTAEEIAAINTSNNVRIGEKGYVTNSSKYDGYGVVKNVAIIKSLKITAYGTNYPHGLSVRIKDQTGSEQDIFLGHLKFDGWKTLEWKNPNYVEEVKNRELHNFPLYPQATPFIKLMGVLVTRDGATVGGDFILYVKDVEVTYDKAVITLDRDIDDEEVWGILTKREEARRDAELRRVGNIQVLRFLEEKKID